MATRLSGRPAIQEPRSGATGAPAPDLRATQVAVQNIRERLRLIEDQLNTSLNADPVVLSGPSANVVTSVQAGLGGAVLRGALQLIGGTGMSISSAGNAIQLSSAATAGVNSLNDLQEDIDLVGGLGITVVTSGQTISVEGNFAAGYGIELVELSGGVLEIGAKLVAGANVNLAYLTDGSIEISATGGGGSGGGGGVTSLNSLTGHVDIAAGDGLSLSVLSNVITLEANLVADDGVVLTALTGGAIAIGANLVAGANVTLTTLTGGAIEISATGGGSGGGSGVSSLNSLTGHVSLVGGVGVSVSEITGNVIEVAANLVADDGIVLTQLTGGAIAIGALLVAGSGVTITPLTGGALEISAAGGSGGGGGVLSLNSLTGHVDLVSDWGIVITAGTGNTINLRATRFTFGSAPPSDSIPGDRWVQDSTGVLFTYVDDGSTEQWVDFNVFGSGSSITLPLSIAEGGTGEQTANDAINALLPSQTGNAGKVLTTDGTDTSWTTGAQTEGSFTPTLTGSGGGSFTGVSGTCTWMRIGDRIIFSGNVQWSGVSGFSGGIRVGGFPEDATEYAGVAIWTQGVLVASAGAWPQCYTTPGVDYLTVAQGEYAGGVTGLSGVSTNGQLQFSGSYKV